MNAINSMYKILHFSLWIKWKIYSHNTIEICHFYHSTKTRFRSLWLEKRVCNTQTSYTKVVSSSQNCAEMVAAIPPLVLPCLHRSYQMCDGRSREIDFTGLTRERWRCRLHPFNFLIVAPYFLATLWF